MAEKTIYDPCPEGWHVPTNVTSKLWLDHSAANEVLDNGGLKYTDGNGKSIYLTKAPINTLYTSAALQFASVHYHVRGGSTSFDGSKGDNYNASDEDKPNNYRLHGRAACLSLRAVKYL